MKKTAFGLALALGVFASSLAFADETTKPATGNTYVEKTDGGDQNVKFDDDPMTALPFDAKGSVISLRPSAVRMMLLRPRTQFITQMLKSVENL